MKLMNWKYGKAGERVMENVQQITSDFLLAEVEKRKSDSEIDEPQMEIEIEETYSGPPVRYAAIEEEIVEVGRTANISAQLEAIVESTSDFVCIGDPEGRLLYINEAGLELIGVDEIRQPSTMTMLDCHPEWAVRIISNEGIPTALRRGVWSGETALLGAGGREIPVSQVIVAHSDSRGGVECLSTIARDITDRKRAELIQVRLRRQAAMRADVSAAMAERSGSLQEALQRCAEAMVRSLDAAFARIWLFDENLQTLELQAGTGLYEHLDGSHGRIPVGRGLVGSIAQALKPYCTNDVQNDPLIDDLQWAVREGMAAFAGFPLMAEDRLAGVMALFAPHELEDDTLTELASAAGTIAAGIRHRKLDEELRESVERERELRRESEEIIRLKDEFLAMISHELRAPLTSILGWTQMMRSGSLDKMAVDRALQTIERNVRTQAHLVGDLLDASRIATGRLQLEKAPVDLMSIVETTVDAVRPLIEENQLRLQLVLEPWVGPFTGDAERMKQIMWNLLNNAIKFTPPGGLIEVRLERLENKALMIISDTGQGIPPEFLPYVFERFRRADNSPARIQGGLGLGLAIVKQLVELHGGAIYPYSRGEGMGTDFMITLPLAIAEQDENDPLYRYTPGDSVAGSGRSQALDGVRILVVDDEYDTREVLSAMLNRYGAEVRTAASAAEAIQKLVDWRPDVLVSDIGMPMEDGYELIGKIRGLPPERGGETPAIALTAYAGNQDRQRALSAGFQRHLAKPVEPTELAREVARTTGKNEHSIV
jgi:PAS domain S-box-containing protein